MNNIIVLAVCLSLLFLCEINVNTARVSRLIWTIFNSILNILRACEGLIGGEGLNVRWRRMRGVWGRRPSGVGTEVRMSYKYPCFLTETVSVSLTWLNFYLNYEWGGISLFWFMKFFLFLSAAKHPDNLNSFVSMMGMARTRRRKLHIIVHLLIC